MFKAGDKVVRKHRYRYCGGWSFGDKVVEVDRPGRDVLKVRGSSMWWDTDNFELYKEKEEVAVQQIEGIPDGYRAVAFRKAERDDLLLSSNGTVQAWQLMAPTKEMYVILEKIEPDSPKTVTVVINKYLVGDLSSPKKEISIVYATEEYVEHYYTGAYRLLGHSETLTVDVEV